MHVIWTDVTGEMNSQHYPEIKHTLKRNYRQGWEKNVGQETPWKWATIWEGEGKEQGKGWGKLRQQVQHRKTLKPQESRWREWKACAAAAGSQSGSQKGRAWRPTWEEPLTVTAHHTWLVCRRSCTNWKGKLEWTRQHSHHRRRKSGWSKKKDEEFRDGNEWSGHKLHAFCLAKMVNLPHLYYLDHFSGS